MASEYTYIHTAVSPHMCMYACMCKSQSKILKMRSSTDGIMSILEFPQIDLTSSGYPQHNTLVLVAKTYTHTHTMCICLLIQLDKSIRFCNYLSAAMKVCKVSELIRCQLENTRHRSSVVRHRLSVSHHSKSEYRKSTST